MERKCHRADEHLDLSDDAADRCKGSVDGAEAGLPDSDALGSLGAESISEFAKSRSSLALVGLQQSRKLMLDGEVRACFTALWQLLRVLLRDSLK